MFAQARLFRLVPFTNVVMSMLAASALALAAHLRNPMLAVCGIVLTVCCLFVASRIGARLALTVDQ